MSAVLQDAQTQAPAGVVVTNRAQERGFSYTYVG